MTKIGSAISQFHQDTKTHLTHVKKRATDTGAYKCGKKAVVLLSGLATETAGTFENGEKTAKAILKLAKLVEKISPGHLKEFGQTFEALEGLCTIIDLVNPFLAVPGLIQLLKDKKAANLDKAHRVNVFVVQVISLFGATSKLGLLKTSTISHLFGKTPYIGKNLEQIKFMQVLTPFLVTLSTLGIAQQLIKLDKQLAPLAKANRKQHFWKNVTDLTSEVKLGKEFISLENKIKSGKKYTSGDAAYKANIDALIARQSDPATADASFIDLLRQAKLDKYKAKKSNIGKEIGKISFGIATDLTKIASYSAIYASLHVAPKSDAGVALAWTTVSLSAAAAAMCVVKIGFAHYVKTNATPIVPVSLVKKDLEARIATMVAATAPAAPVAA